MIEDSTALRACVYCIATNGVAGDWKMEATIASGQPAAIAHRRGDDGAHIRSA